MIERCASTDHCMISSPKEEYRGLFFCVLGGRAKVHSEKASLDCSSFALDLIRPGGLLLIVLEKALTI